MESKTPTVLFADNHLLCVCKPTGMPSQPDQTGVPSLYDWARKWIRAEKGKIGGDVYCGIVHRLDRNVSGVMVLARTSKAASRLSAQFSSRSAEKTYVALVSPPPSRSEASLVHHLAKQESTRRATVHQAPGSGTKEAITRYITLESREDRALLQVHPQTGRYHQIRAQLAYDGSPVVGDSKYGSDASFEGLALHALALAFEHPVQKVPLELVSLVPASWDTWVNDLLAERGWSQSDVDSVSQSLG